MLHPMNKLGRSCWQCVDCKAARLLADVTPEVVDGLDREKTTRHYHRGDILYHQGDPNLGLFCISSGHIKVYHTDAKGKCHIIRLAGAGDFLGASSFVTGRPHSLTAEALSAAVVCLIGGRSVRSALQSDPQMVANVMTSLAQTLEETEAQLASMAQLSSASRIVKVLLEHSPSTSVQARVAPLTREEIGNLSGTSMETVSRLIHSLTRQGFLRLRARTIFIVQRAALEQLVAESVGEN